MATDEALRFTWGILCFHLNAIKIRIKMNDKKYYNWELRYKTIELKEKCIWLILQDRGVV